VIAAVVETLYKLADGSFHEHRMSLPMYLRELDGLKRHLEGHHSIEEQYIFPDLAKRMPEFAENEKHLQSHAAIHHGLEELGKLTREYRAEPSTYNPEKIRECLDSFRDVLMRHLDEEVTDLRGENLKKYWTLKEVQRFAV